MEKMEERLTIFQPTGDLKYFVLTVNKKKRYRQDLYIRASGSPTEIDKPENKMLNYSLYIDSISN